MARISQQIYSLKTTKSRNFGDAKITQFTALQVSKGSIIGHWIKETKVINYVFSKHKYLCLYLVSIGATAINTVL